LGQLSSCRLSWPCVRAEIVSRSLWHTARVQPSDNDPGAGSLSDEALVRQALPLASRFGCKIVGLALLVTLASGLGWGLQGGMIGFASSVCMLVLLRWLRAKSPTVQQARAAERELGRRFGALPLAQQLSEARAQLAASADLEVVGLFRGRVLPHGALRSMRMEIGAQPKLVLSTAPALAELQRGSASSTAMIRRELPLTAAQVERSRALLRDLATETLAPLASFVVDGFACEASVLQRDAAELHASANLAGLPDQLRHHPSVRLIELFLDLESELVTDGHLG
jgi:hypothetical protein